MSGLSPALAQQLQTTITAWNANQAQFADWLGGVVGGGPNHDGRYPLTNALGVETLVSCPAAIVDEVAGPAAQVEIAKLAANESAGASASSATAADASKVLADAAKNAAVTARNQAQTAQSNAANHEANARYWAELAQGHGADVQVAVETITELSQQTAANAVAAEASAVSAADSAELAAHFEPANFDLKSDPIAANRISGTLSLANLPIMPGPAHFASTGGFAELTAAQQSAMKSGDFVTITDGRRFVYRGGGSKTVETSYIKIADDTPAWTEIVDKPTTFLPSTHSHNHTDINGFTWANLGSKPTTFAPSTHGHAWGEITGIPATFAPSAHTHGMTDITGLPDALDLKAPKANAAFSTPISVNGAVGAHSFSANHSLFYPDGNHTVIKTGPGGQERYWRFDADGTLYGLNGNIYSNYNMQAMGSLIVGASTAANRVNVEKGWVELRNDGYGPYVDFSTDATTDFHARISIPKSDGRLWLSHGQGGSVIVGPTIEANSNNGSQAGSVITHAGTEQVMAKQLTFPSFMNPQDNGANALLEVRGAGGGYGAWMKFHRPGAWGTYFGMFENGRWGWGGWSDGAVINEFWTTKNFDPLTRMERYNDGWIQTRDANDRFYFASNGRSYYKSKGGHEWRNGSDVWTGIIDNDGNLTVRADTSMGNKLQLRGTNPTVVLRDTDNRSAMIHVNANRFYVLRGSGTDSDGWASTGGGWPLEIDLENNNATFGANIYTGIDQWFRVRGSTGIYWENWGGGWFMNDSSWLRAYNDKNIVTGGQVQMGSFTVTSDRRLKTDITPIPLAQASDIIDRTNVYEFTKGGRRMFGMIAQEAREVAPILVSEGADTHEDGDAILSLDQTGYIPLLIAEVQALRQRVAQLEGTIH